MVAPGRRPDEDRRIPDPSSQDRSRARDTKRTTSGDRPRPWQRPPQFQHGFRDNIFGDAETTGALLARLATVRALAELPGSPMWRRPRSNATMGGPGRMPSAHDAASAYLRLLDRVLEDRVITDAEVRRLREVAKEWGIGALEADHLHRTYIALVWHQAWADDTLTEGELRDIKTLARLLGVPVHVPREEERRRPGSRWVAVPIEPAGNAIESRAESTLPERPPSGPGAPGPRGRAPVARLKQERVQR